MEYRAVSSDYAGALDEKVSKLLKEGFKLQGGVAVAMRAPSQIYCVQALYRDAPAGGKRKTRRN